jgi:small subunit ribosomal protein S1
MSDASSEGPRPSNIVHATIAGLDGDSVHLTAGEQRWTMSRAETGIVTVGSAIDVYVDNDGAKTFVSKRMADALNLWDDLARAANHGGDVEGEIIAVVKGGLSVDVGMRGFLPASQAAIRPMADLSPLVGQRLKLRVLELDARRGRVVVSRRALLEAERAVQREALLKTLSVGDKVSGAIVSFVGYGAFVDIGGVDALLRIEDMSWGHIRHGSQLFAEGDIVQAKVLDVNKDKGRVAIGVKHLTPDPWAAVPGKYPEGAKVRGTVLRLAEFGAFVEVEPNVEALLHVSEMKWGKSTRKPGDIVHKGQSVEVVVLDVDAGERRMSLGMKQLTPNPWKTLRDSHRRGARLHGTVRSITDFGIFVELETGVDGLVHASDMSWTDRVRPAEAYNAGDAIEVVLLDVNVDQERIALGVKQLCEDPWVAATRDLRVNAKVTGKVTGISDFGAFVEIAPNLQGLCHITEMTEDRDARPADLVKVGDELTVTVLEIDAPARRISLSVLANERDDASAAPQKPFSNNPFADKLSKA